MRYSIAVVILMLFSTSLCADDWPQWMGMKRDNVWRESGVIKRFPEGGPKILWRTPIAGGYAGPAVADGRVYVTDYVSKENLKVDNFGRKELSGTERVLCLDEATGKEIWKHEYPVVYGISYPAGPRCTPNVDGDRVYTLGAEGHLYCFRAETGDVIWSRDLTTEYNTKSALWGYAGHPLIDGDKLICIVGGEGSHVVALDKHTGKEKWRALTATEQGYSPPIIMNAGGVRQLILPHPDAVVSLDPESGNEYWSIEYGATNGSIIMTPIKSGNLLYVGGYSNKNLLIELGESSPTAKALWRDEPKTALSPINVQPLEEGGIMYGFDQSGLLHGVDIKSGKRLWQSTEPLSSKRPVGSGTAFMVKHEDRVWMFNELGELLITKLSPEGYTEIDRAKVIEPSNVAFGRKVVWAAPAWANKKAFIRNDDECICVNLGAN